MCQDCGHQHFQWIGQCPSCKEWNTFVQEKIALVAGRSSQPLDRAKPIQLDGFIPQEQERFTTCLPEFDRLLGGGVVPGVFCLLGGEPGIGKSTLMMQLAHGFASQDMPVLYVSGEESVEQTSLRAKRLGVKGKHLYVLSTTSLEEVLTQAQALKPKCLVVDSIQIVYKEEVPSAPGSVAQVRECASELMRFAKDNNIPVFIIGHVTKSGEIAGPRVLEHLVDTVLYFEGDRQHQFRLVRVVKNRFGPTDEIAVFQMKQSGLQQIANPSEIFLEQRKDKVSGSAVICTLEGSRPFLVEVQSLVSHSVYPSPSRRSTGVDPNRLALLLAVLEKRVRFKTYACDVFVSVVGGMKIQEPAIDLGVLLSLAASFKNKIIDPGTVLIGEVGLGGEVRPVPKIETRIKEAQRMGFTTCFVPQSNLKGLDKALLEGIALQGVETVDKVIYELIL